MPFEATSLHCSYILHLIVWTVFLLSNICQLILARITHEGVNVCLTLTYEIPKPNQRLLLIHFPGCPINWAYFFISRWLSGGLSGIWRSWYNYIQRVALFHFSRLNMKGNSEGEWQEDEISKTRKQGQCLFSLFSNQRLITSKFTVTFSDNSVKPVRCLSFTMVNIICSF